MCLLRSLVWSGPRPLSVSLSLTSTYLFSLHSISAGLCAFPQTPRSYPCLKRLHLECSSHPQHMPPLPTSVGSSECTSKIASCGPKGAVSVILPGPHLQLTQHLIQYLCAHSVSFLMKSSCSRLTLHHPQAHLCLHHLFSHIWVCGGSWGHQLIFWI